MLTTHEDEYQDDGIAVLDRSQVIHFTTKGIDNQAI
jgi:hypothetical protein